MKNNNYTPLAVFCFFASIFLFFLGLFFLLGDINFTSYGLIESSRVNKIIAIIIMVVLSLFFLIVGIGYLRKTRDYYRKEKAFDNEYIDSSIKDEISKRMCPKCGNIYDIDYPKCSSCKHNYLE